MKLRDIEQLLAGWQERGLVSSDQAAVIIAHEAADRAEEPHDAEPGVPIFDVGSILSYGGVFVALVAVIGLYSTILGDLTPWARFGLAVAVAAGAVVLSFTMHRLRGAAAADALGFSAVVLVGWAIFQFFDALGWADTTDEATTAVRVAFLVTMLGAAGVGWFLARTVPAPLAGMAAAVAATGTLAAIGWFFDRGDSPGEVAGQLAVIGGFAIAGAALTGNLLQLDDRARSLWIIGALIATNVVAFILSAVHGGLYEGLLLPYAIALAAAAILGRRRSLLVFAAIFLYEYVGFVVFRTFGGAVAAIIILALIGLGTAIGGMAAQRGIGIARFRALLGRE